MPERKSSESSSSESDGEVDQTPANDLVVTKYGMAAEIVNATLKAVIAEVKEGVEVLHLCDVGDKMLMEKTAKIFKKEKNMTKGIAMPTCVSIDNCICHFSPLRSDPPVILKNGQFVKIDLGAHIDGFIAVAAHTVVVGASKENKVEGKKANVLKAAHDALEIAIRMLRPGTKNSEISEYIDRTAEEYEVKPVENMLSNSLERNKVDGEKQIIQNPGEKQKGEVEKCEIDVHDVFAIEVLFSTGEGRARDMDTRTTVFKKSDEVTYQLKIKHSRAFISDVMAKSGVMPFSLRSFDNENKAKMGVVECERHGLVKPYQVLYEKEGEYVAQFKSTVLVMPNGLLKITGLPLDTDSLETTLKLKNLVLLERLNQPLKIKKKKADDEKKDGTMEGDKQKADDEKKAENKEEKAVSDKKAAETKKAEKKEEKVVSDKKAAETKKAEKKEEKVVSDSKAAETKKAEKKEEKAVSDKKAAETKKAEKKEEKAVSVEKAAETNNEENKEEKATLEKKSEKPKKDSEKSTPTKKEDKKTPKKDKK